MQRFSSLTFLATIGLLAGPAVLGQGPCEIVQITDSPTEFSSDPSVDDGAIAFRSRADHAGSNPDGNIEIFLYDGVSTRQITGSTSGRSNRPSLDNGAIAFESDANLTGNNPDELFEIFLWNGSSISQITDSSVGGKAVPSFEPSLDGGSIAFTSFGDLAGNNPDGNSEIFLYDGSSFTQITDSTSEGSGRPSLDGDSIAFASEADLTGRNPDANAEIFLWDGSDISQITTTFFGNSLNPRLDAGFISFFSNENLTGGNPDGSFEVFLVEDLALTQITDSSTASSGEASPDGGSIAFTSEADLTGQNPDGNEEIFFYDGSSITQVTESPTGDSRRPSLDGSSIAFESNADLTGQNPDGNTEVFLATCDCLRDDIACLRDGRFRVEVDWRFTPDFPDPRPAQVAEIGTSDSALFYFLDPANLEFLIKVLRGCSINGHYWVFFAGTTTVEFTVSVTDTETGIEERYTNPQDQPADAVIDTSAFATCP